ncbi:MAG: molybdopterin-dependent oxidoreductase [Coriobacteriales bacterium]|jgi:anaerobic dimethyl sulfoxide reductase subunit A|nr:molybdopterin-dependent oxidoreductase [Coriobacteriales bacterium]
MSGFIEGLQERGLDRRQFIAASAVATASVGLLGLSGCSTGENQVTDTSLQQPVQEGTWVTAGCNYDCGGRCLNKAYVVDGIVVKQKTDDTHEDTPDHPQQRACVRGRSQRNMVYGADRVKYPMKRSGWSADNPNGQMRGKDSWVRISWDEAIEIVASELKKAKDSFGNESILFPSSWTGPTTEIANVLHAFGGYLSTWGSGSFGSYSKAPTFGYEYWTTSINDRFDFLNSEVIVLLGVNPSWSSGGNGFYYYLRVKEAGAKFIAVDPFYNDSAAALGADWMPIRVGTDMALLLGVAYVLITEDDPGTNPLIDWEFLRNYSVGFDETMMPEGADPQHNFKNYILGSIDGIAKTPEWAFEICGLDTARIKELAYAIKKDKAVSIVSGWANGRVSETASMPQILMTIGCMTGHFGKPGHSCGANCHRGNINAGPFLYTLGSNGLPQFGAGLSVASGSSGPTVLEKPIKKVINTGDVWDVVLNGHGPVSESGGNVANVEQDFDIHVIANIMGANMETVTGGDRAIAAYRKVDFVFAVSQYPSGNAFYADVILPLVVFWEKTGFFSEIGTRDALIACSKLIEPMYEIKTSKEIALMLAAKLDVDADELFPFDEKQAWFNMLATTTVVDTDGITKVPLATIAQSDIDEWGAEGTPQEGKIALSDLLEKGEYQFDLKPGDNYTFIAYKDFVADPVANPLKTTSGKFEIYSQAYADLINTIGYATKDPLPTYQTGPERFEETFSDWTSKTKNDYPFQLYSIHYLGHAHSVFSNCQWIQEAFSAPLYMNTEDAAAQDIKEADTVLVESKHGRVLRRAYVTDRVMPGNLVLPHGSWKDPDSQEIDAGGNDNSLCGVRLTGYGVSSYNSIIVKISKYSGEPILPDVQKPRRVLVES